MLIIKELEVLDNHKFNIQKRKYKKTQILLFDTRRRVEDYIAKLKYRKNGKYEDIPHFIVTKLGHVIEIIDTNYSSVTFEDPKTDRKLIKIAIENLGWLNKNTITGFLNNWIGDAYRSEPCVRGWREHFYWDKYTQEQHDTIVMLCQSLCEKHDIPFKAVPSQGYIENISKFKGIACKSNYSNIYTDINPSFNFKIFAKNEKKDESV